MWGSYLRHEAKFKTGRFSSSTCILALIAATSVIPVSVSAQQVITWHGNGNGTDIRSGAWNSRVDGPNPPDDNPFAQWRDGTPVNKEFEQGDHVIFSGSQAVSGNPVEVIINQDSPTVPAADGDDILPGSITFSPGGSNTRFVINNSGLGYVGNSQIASDKGRYDVNDPGNISQETGVLEIKTNLAPVSGLGPAARIDAPLAGKFVLTGTAPLALGGTSSNLTSLDVTSGASVVVDGALGSTTNQATVTNSTGGTFDLNTGGSIDGALNNSGTAFLAGNVDKITNGENSTLTFDGQVATSEKMENSGTINVVNPGKLTAQDGFTNESTGTINITEGGTLNSVQGVNTNKGTIDIRGLSGQPGVFAGKIENAAGANINIGTGGILKGTVVNEAGTGPGQAGGTLTVDGDLLRYDNGNGGGVTNNQFGQVNVNGNGYIEGTLTNSGTANIAGGVGVVNNSGQVDVNSTGNIEGKLTNSGTANIAGDVGTIDNEGAGDLTFYGNNPTTLGTGITNSRVLTNSATTTVNSGAFVSAGNNKVVNEETGQMDVAGTIAGTVVNFANGSNNNNVLNIDGVINGTLNNSGSANISGRVSDVYNLQSGNLTFDENGPSTTAEVGDSFATGMAVLKNFGTTTINENVTVKVLGGNEVFNNAVGRMVIRGTLDGNITNYGNGTPGSSGDRILDVQNKILGTLENHGHAHISGSVDEINNRQNGKLVFSGFSVSSNKIFNESQIKVENGLSLTVTNSFTNSGESAILNVGSLPGPTPTPTSTLNGNVFNENKATMTVNENGVVVGDITNEAGSSATDFGGKLTINGQVTGGSVINRLHSEVDLNSTGSIEYNLTNGGIATVAGNIDGIVNTQSGKLTFDGGSGADSVNLGTSTALPFPVDVLTNVGRTTINSGATVNILNNNRVRNDTTGRMVIKGTLNGNIDNFANGVGGPTDANILDINKAINGTLNNDGHAFVSGHVNIIENLGDGDLTFDGGTAAAPATVGNVSSTTATDVLKNSGNTTIGSGSTVRVLGAAGNQLLNESAGRMVIDGTLIGNVTNKADGFGTGASQNTLNVNERINGRLTNDGHALVSGHVTSITNSGTGRLTFNDAPATDPATLGDSSTSNVTVFTNDGLTIIGSASTVKIQGVSDNQIINNSTGRMVIDGKLLGDITNSADGQNSSLGNQILKVDGVIDGTLKNTGHASIAGDVTTINNFSGGEIKFSQSMTTTNVMTNSGIASVDGNVLLTASNGVVNNSGGVFKLVDNSRVAGKLTNLGTTTVKGTVELSGLEQSGIIIMSENGSGSDNLKIVTNTTDPTVTFTDGSVIRLDADMSEDGNDIDKINITGSVSGKVTLSFNNIEGDDYGVVTSTFMTFDSAAADFKYDITDLRAVGGIVYVVDRKDNTLRLSTASNPNIGALAGAVTLTQSLIGSVINRPSSPFVTGLADSEVDPCSPGGWGRVIGGSADATGTTSSTSTTGENISFDSRISASYSGIQVGGDYSCFGGAFNGWDLSVGGIFGVNQGKTTQPLFAVDNNSQVIPDVIISNNRTKFNQLYGGVYLSAARDKLLFDLQYRHEKTSFDLTNDGTGAARVGIINQSFDSKAHTLSGSVSYAMPLSEKHRISFIPTAGFAYTKTSTDPIYFITTDDSDPAAPVEKVGFLQIEDSTTEVGFLGGSLAMTKIRPDGRSALTYFGTATFYKDFADPVRSVFYNEPGAQGLETYSSNLGEYGEISLGLNYTKLLDPGRTPGNARQMNASIRLDGRAGDTLDSWGITGQFRIQF